MVKLTSNHDKKLEELILLVSRKLEDDPRYCATKLNKVLFFADFLHYRKKGKPITGQEYQKLEHGPSPRGLLPTRRQMIEDRLLSLVPRDYCGLTQHVPVAQRDPDLDIFTPEEIDLIDTVIEHLRPYNARECSELSHSFIGWELAEIQETIPYGVSLLTHAEDDNEEQDQYCDEVQGRAEQWLLVTK